MVKQGMIDLLLTNRIVAMVSLELASWVGWLAMVHSCGQCSCQDNLLQRSNTHSIITQLEEL